MWWRANFFGYAWPWVGTLMDSLLIRAIVVATGAVTVIAGASELRDAIARHLPEDPPSA